MPRSVAFTQLYREFGTTPEPGQKRVQVQVHAKLDERTCAACLEAAGQVIEVGQPFRTELGEFITPPFHINCRCIVAPFRKGFETTTQAKAQKLLAPIKARRRSRAAKRGWQTRRASQNERVTGTLRRVAAAVAASLRR